MLKQIVLKKSGVNRIKSNHIELKADDVETSLKSIHPGEWIFLTAPEGQWLAFVNPMIEAPLAAIAVLSFVNKSALTLSEDEIAKSFIKEKIEVSSGSGNDGLAGH